MKPRINSVLRYTALTLVFTATVPALQAETWNIAGPVPVFPNYYNWNDPASWLEGTIPNAVDATALLSNNLLFNGPAGPQLQGTIAINLNTPVTLGNITVGDSNNSAAGFNGNGFFRIFNGSGGSLRFDATTDLATLQKTSGNGATDTISATVTLTDTLAADVRTGTIVVDGLIGGPGGLIRSGSVSGAVTNTGGTLNLTNSANSFAGGVTIEHGVLSATLNSDVLPGANSVLGKSATDIILGVSSFGPATASNNFQHLILQAGSDAANYTVARGLDFSGVTQSGAGQARVEFTSNSAGGLNTNRLTLSGPILLVSLASRAVLFNTARAGMTIDLTGPMSTNGVATSINLGLNIADPNVDGPGGGNYRFSNLERTNTGSLTLNVGNVIIDGVVGAAGATSPIGTPSIALASGGSSGNIIGNNNFTAGAAASRDTSPFTVRRIYLESPGSSYARALAPGGGNSSTGTSNNYVSNVNVINGFQFGGLNTSGLVTFSGNITPGNPVVGAHPTNLTTTAVNMALSCATGGTALFSGNIVDGTTVAGTSTRVTINQFRNHPNLDGNNGTVVGADGVPDAAANQLVGTPTSGTVIVSGANTYEGGTEVLGGTLTVDNAVGSGTGTGNVRVFSGAKLGGTGTISASAILENGAGLAFTVNTPLGDHNSFDIATNLTLLGTTAVTILDGIGSEIGTYTLATVAGTFGGTPLATPILPLGMNGTVSVVGNELRLNVTQVVSADYLGWIDGFPTITGADRGLTADPDGDGLTNRQEYAFGLAPDSGVSVSPIVSQLDKTTGKFTYTRRTLGLPDPDLAYTIETSVNLTTWNPDNTAIQTVTGNVGEVQTVEVTLTGTKPLAAPLLFVRVVAK